MPALIRLHTLPILLSLGWLCSAEANPLVISKQTDWKAVDGCAREISIIRYDRPLVVGCAGTGNTAGQRGYEIYRRTSGTWVKQARPGYKAVDLGPDLTPWIIDLKGVVWRGGTRQSGQTECISEIAASDRPDIWSVTCPGKNGATIVMRARNLLPAAAPDRPGDLNANSWERIPVSQPIRKIAVGDDIWMLDRAGGLSTFDRAFNKWITRPGCATDIAANGPHVWVIGCEAGAGAGNQIFRWENNNWTLLKGAAVKVAVDSLGNPWVVDYNGGIWTWTYRTPGG